MAEDPMKQASSGVGLRIALVALPDTGHSLPLLRIAPAVMRRGHHVKVFTCDFGVKGMEAMAAQAGVEVVAVDMGGETDKSIKDRGEAQGRVHFLLYHEVMRQPLAEALAAFRPDAVVTDFATLAGMDAAATLEVPLVINFPAQLALMNTFLSAQGDPSTHHCLFGLHVARARLTGFGFAVWLNAKGFGTWSKIMRQHIARGPLLLVQTVWGLDAPQPLPPNMVVTGPLLSPAADQRRKQTKDHQDLYSFLHSGSDSVIYVTTGSLVELSQWQVEAIFRGLKQVGCRVVWSLKEAQQEYLPCKGDPQFFVSKWTPQAELLQDDAVKVVITHCGWGGTLECAAGGKPMVTMPFFGDQPANAELIVAAGVGEHLGKPSAILVKPQNPYRLGDFTPDSVAVAVNKVLSDPRYAAKASKLAAASRACGGVEAAAQQIEWAAKFGTAHLHSGDFARTCGCSPFNGVALGGLVGLCAVAGLLVYKCGLKGQGSCRTFI